MLGTRQFLRGAANLAALATVVSYAPALASENSPLYGGALSAYSGGDKTTPLSAPEGVLQAGRVAGARALSDPLSMSRLRGALSALTAEDAESTRGAHDVALYRDVSPSVVLVVTEDALGSGSLISPGGRIVTNYHVVGDAEEVGVIFKPAQEGREITKSDVVRARVIKIDQIADLALLQVTQVSATAKPLKLGSLTTLSVGSDVHAIGHPTGEAWSYTGGIVSQIRRGYRWTTESGLAHTAVVIQTQTPINPGNSGGPLLDDSGELVGVNSFKGEGEGLNFAVSVEDVQKFLAATGNRLAQAVKPAAETTNAAQCEPKELSRERVKDPAGVGIAIDADCDGDMDGVMLLPDDASKPLFVMLDGNGDGDIDTWLLDFERDGVFDKSLYDTNSDGDPDLVGYYRNGETEPYRFEPYKG